MRGSVPWCPLARRLRGRRHRPGTRRARTRGLSRPLRFHETDRESTRLNYSHAEIYTLSLHDALPICSMVPIGSSVAGSPTPTRYSACPNAWPVSASAVSRNRSGEHTSELQPRRDLHSFPTRRSSDLFHGAHWLVGCGVADPDQVLGVPERVACLGLCGFTKQLRDLGDVLLLGLTGEEQVATVRHALPSEGVLQIGVGLGTLEFSHCALSLALSCAAHRAQRPCRCTSYPATVNDVFSVSLARAPASSWTWVSWTCLHALHTR